MSPYGRLATFKAGGTTRYGAVTAKGVVDLSSRHSATWPSLRDVIEAGALRRLADEAEGRDADYATDEIAYEIPVPAPEKIICVGVNYPERNEEYKDGQAASSNPSLFVRFPRSFVGHGRPLTLPAVSPQLDYEGELVVVIGKAGRHIGEKDATTHIAALTLCNEGTIRDWVRHAKFNVTQGKNFDGSGALGPWLAPFVDEAQIADVRLTAKVNGELRQDDRTSRMTFPIRKLLSYISTFTTLVPGDVIVTGTPAGAGARRDPPVWLKPGDVVDIEADGVGVLSNGVVMEGVVR